MRVRMVAVFAIVAAFGIGAYGQQTNSSPKPGENVILHMTGDLAKAYVQKTGFGGAEVRDGLEISMTATVEQQLEDGRLRIEHSSPVKIEGKTGRMVTLSVTVESARITSDRLPKGSQIYAAPAPKKDKLRPIITEEETTTYRLHLSDLKGLKLRSWTLAEEIGE